VNKERVTILIELLDEGAKSWRPVLAEHVSEDIYRIVDRVPEGEVWLFQPGQLVRCRQQEFADGTNLAAFESMPIG